MADPSPPDAAWMRLLPPAARLILHGDSAARAAAMPAWGVAFAEAPCRAVAQGSRATLWLGPDEYLLWEAERNAAELAQASLAQALRGIPHALVDISHRQIALQISGPNAEPVLSGACPLDVHIQAFPVGMCTRTVLAKADIVLWRTGADTFHLEVWRSFAGYVSGLLREIGAEFYPTQ
jgi:sarcosine oxidase, subunit gamma